MHLVSALASGVRGAEQGLARVYVRGTKTAAAYYMSFEGLAPNTSGDPIQLDANGGAEIYVNVPTTIEVTSPAGLVVRNFVSSASAPNVEVRSVSFTGTDYDDGAGQPKSGPSKPTTVQAVLDKVKASFGAEDFNVLAGGATKTLQAALASFSGLFFNVKDPTFGAKGDGVTPDLSAFDAAASAAQAANGGIVFIPPGTYILENVWSVPTKVGVLGLGPNASILATNHSTNGIIKFAGTAAAGYRPFQTCEGLYFRGTVPNTGDVIRIEDANLLMRNCAVGDGVNLDGMLITTGTSVTAGELYIDGCAFVSHSDMELINIDDTNVRAHISRCLFTPHTTMNQDCVTIRSGTMERCRFINGGVVVGTYKNVGVVSAGTGGTSVSGCTFEASGGAAVSTAIHMGLITSKFAEGANVFFTTNKITGISGSDHRERLALASARLASEVIAHSGTSTVVCDTDNFDTTVINTSNTQAGDGAGFTFDLGPAIVAHTHTVIVHQTGGGTTGSVNPGANTKAKTHDVSSGQYRAWHFRGFATTPGSVWSWMQVAQSEEAA